MHMEYMVLLPWHLHNGMRVMLSSPHLDFTWRAIPSPAGWDSNPRSRQSRETSGIATVPCLLVYLQKNI
jgi:hypothetical protein